MAKRACRPVDGIFLLDKPAGMTSNRALQEVKRRFQACKAGHTGSLDPLATGLLPICLGEATKVSQYLLDADKSYRAVLRLGVSTATYDAEGEVTATRPVAVDQGQVEQALTQFAGSLLQRPPAFSAIKQGGQPVYKRARAGMAVEIAPRPVVVYEIHLVSLDQDLLTLDLRVSKGTYIRSLAHDLGEVLGCGAHIAELRRTGLGRFSVQEARTLSAIEGGADPACLLPVDAALAHLPAVYLSPAEARMIGQGQPVTPDQPFAPGLVRIYSSGAFLGIGEMAGDGRLAPRRMRAVPEESGILAEKSVEDGGLRG